MVMEVPVFRRLVLVLLALALTLLAARSRAEDLPADTLEDLVARARAHQEETEQRIRRYSWIQHEELVVTKPSGEIVEQGQRRVRVFPFDGGVITELLEVDGRMPTKKELAQNERRNQRMQDRARKAEARHSEAAGEGEPEEAPSGALIELLSRTRFELAGRLEQDGRELIGIAFEPDPRAPGEGVEKKLLRHSRGTVWLDAETAQPVRGEAGAADKFRVKGVVGVKDFSLVAEQVRIGGEVWLPSRLVFEGDVSLLGMKRRFRTEVAFSDYSRASTAVEAEVGGPVSEEERSREP